MPLIEVMPFFLWGSSFVCFKRNVNWNDLFPRYVFCLEKFLICAPTKCVLHAYICNLMLELQWLSVLQNEISRPVVFVTQVLKKKKFFFSQWLSITFKFRYFFQQYHWICGMMKHIGTSCSSSVAPGAGLDYFWFSPYQLYFL